MAEKKTRSGGERKTEKGKDPDAPKRPLSSYMYFAMENRATIKEENPDADFGQIGKLTGAKWKELSDKEKQPYVAQADADKERYTREMADYTGTSTTAETKKKSTSSKKSK